MTSSAMRHLTAAWEAADRAEAPDGRRSADRVGPAEEARTARNIGAIHRREAVPEWMLTLMIFSIAA